MYTVYEFESTLHEPFCINLNKYKTRAKLKLKWDISNKYYSE